MKTNYIYSFTKEPFDINLTIMKWQEGCAFVQQQQLVQNIMEAYLLSNCDFIKRLFRLQKCHIKFQIKRRPSSFRLIFRRKILIERSPRLGRQNFNFKKRKSKKLTTAKFARFRIEIQKHNSKKITLGAKCFFI